MPNISKQNNFDLIRILAALQVVFIHGSKHLEVNNSFIIFLRENLLKYFPGVPIFFFVSGFLIYWSYERSDKIKKYARNRALRIFPALILCVLVCSILLVAESKSLILLKSAKYYIWIVTQCSLFQFYTPEILRFWGVGTPNGSLWTITVELQFYLVVPLLSLIINRWRKEYVFILIIAISIFSNIIIGQLPEETMTRKLGNVFILPYLYYFVFGVMTYKYWEILKRFFEGKFIFWIVAYLIFINVFGNVYEYNLARYWIESPLSIVSHIMLAGVTCSFAFSYTSISHKILRGNDISYGVYIYHMLVINFFVQHKLINTTGYFFMVFFITLCLASLSWIFIEKKFLSLKREILKPKEVPVNIQVFNLSKRENV